MISRRTLIAATAALPLATRATAQARPQTPWPPAEHVKLWPGPPPGAPNPLPRYAPEMSGNPADPELWLRGVVEPVIGVFRAERPDGRAVLSIPGGGYGFVSIENEGIDVARALNPQGITVFALAYRLPGEGWANRADVPLQDAQRAMRLIRANAARYAIDPTRLAALGFSAGGHLAAALTVGHADRVYAPIDAADRQSARPDATGLVYPVTRMSDPRTRGRSTDNLLGPTPAPETVTRYDTPPRVRADTPPLFIAHAMDDPAARVEESFAILAAARAANVPVEAHLFERGGHGFGARRAAEGTPPREWPHLFDLWLRQRFNRTAA